MVGDVSGNPGPDRVCPREAWWATGVVAAAGDNWRNTASQGMDDGWFVMRGDWQMAVYIRWSLFCAPGLGARRWRLELQQDTEPVAGWVSQKQDWWRDQPEKGWPTNLILVSTTLEPLSLISCLTWMGAVFHSYQIWSGCCPFSTTIGFWLLKTQSHCALRCRVVREQTRFEASKCSSFFLIFDINHVPMVIGDVAPMIWIMYILYIYIYIYIYT